MFPKRVWHACDTGDMGDLAHLSQSARSQEHERGLEQRESMGGVAVMMQPLHGRRPSAILAAIQGPHRTSRSFSVIILLLAVPYASADHETQYRIDKG